MSSRRTASSIVSPGSMKPASAENMPGGKCRPRPTRHASPCVANMIATGSVRGKCSVLQAAQTRFQPPSARVVRAPHLGQKPCRSCQSMSAFAVPRIAMSRSPISMAAPRMSLKWPSPASGPSFAGSRAAEISSAKTARSPSRPRKMQGASGAAKVSAKPGRRKPASKGGSAFSGPRMKGCNRHMGSTSEPASTARARRNSASPRRALARSRGLPVNGIMAASRSMLATAAPHLAIVGPGGWRGRSNRQPGQVRKEAAVTNPLRVVPASHLTPRLEMDEQEPSFGLDAPAPPREAYRVLARKYRPSDFTGLIGQEALVRTLSNAFALGRIAHAFMLTGVRGVGKTTTARIIARALNCIGPDGKRTEPTIHPCGVCDPCVTIAESRNVDVQEMDAASNNGVDEVRQIIEAVRYAPASSRYKVYILDEVHMLSKAAFNAILKTLEEPPPHVKFIFATTEIRKVPVTVLSRCQRFDLRRIESAELAQYLGQIAAKENVTIEEGALALIARAAEGSARDALSLLDQAIAHNEKGAITAETMREMLGLADRGRVLDLFEKVMKGDVPAALNDLGALYDSGADPLAVMQDLLEITHFLTRLKVAPAAQGFFDGASGEAKRAAELAAKLQVSSPTRAWQMLLKGLLEVRDAVRPISACEMALIRLAYAADLPPADKLVRDVLDNGVAPRGAAPASPPPHEGGGTRA